jgi:chromate transporter
MENKRTQTPTSFIPSFAEAFRFWLKLGFISFGGPAGQIAIMQRVLRHSVNLFPVNSFLHLRCLWKRAGGQRDF